MSDKKYAPIYLNMEEAIWLDHRANQVEIISLELVPDVDVYEEASLIHIRGHLVLQGKFEAEEEDESFDLESSSIAEQLQFDPLEAEPKEVYQEEYRGVINHRFPFVVTIPRERIANVADVFVHVEQFDYHLSDGHRLSIKTDVSILGVLAVSEVVNNELNEQAEKVEAEEQVVDTVEVARQESKETFFSSPTVPVAISVAATQDEVSALTPVNEHVTSQDEESRESEPEPEREPEVENSQEQITVSSIEEQMIRSEQPEQAEEEIEDGNALDELGSFPEENQPIRTNFYSSAEKAPTPDLVATFEPPSVPEPVIQNQERVAEQSESKTVSFLSQLLDRDDEEQPRMSKLKMCIIQKNESLEDISRRYSTSVYEIMKLNRLENDSIAQGQILYIPHT